MEQIERFTVYAVKNKFTESISGQSAAQAARLEAKLISQGYTVSVTRELPPFKSKHNADNSAK